MPANDLDRQCIENSFAKTINGVSCGEAREICGRSFPECSDSSRVVELGCCAESTALPLAMCSPSVSPSLRCRAGDIPATCKLSQQRNPGTSCATSPRHHVRISRVQDRVRGFPLEKDGRARATFPQSGARGGVQKRHAHRSKYRNLLPCQIARHCASNNHSQDRRDKSPCIARTESDRVNDFAFNLVAKRQVSPLVGLSKSKT